MEGTGNKKFRRVLKRLIFIPLAAMIIALLIGIIACFYSVHNLQEQMAERNVNALEFALSQLGNLFSRAEQPFYEFLSTNENHQALKRMKEDTPSEETLVYESNVRKWLDQQANANSLTQTAFVYYRNLGWYQFRGASVFDVQKYVTEQLLNLGEETEYSGWRLIQVGGSWYLLYLLHIGDFCGGEWISLKDLQMSLGLDAGSGTYPGELYLRDAHGRNTCSKEEIRKALLDHPEAETVSADGQEYLNTYVTDPDTGMSLGFCSERTGILGRLPLPSKILFIAAFFAVILVVIVVLWLQRRIVSPVWEMDEAMKIIAEGNLDYRLPTTNYSTYNEFDRLAVHFNAMMDKLDEAQFQLYQTQIREQKTKLMYISQQIRPHFILNALNIIYTYDESEFPLVKKMVMYLTAYFRYIVNLNRDFVEVSEELEHTRNYLKIQKERYPHRFDYLVECGMKAERILIPPLIIQTFLENSIKYGMKDEGQSFFFVNVAVRDGLAEIFIADTGGGFPEETLAKIRAFLENRENAPDLGVGIVNAVERLDMLYDGKARLEFYNEETGGAVVRILVPAMYADNA